jgi:hypothetical protein
MDWGGRPRVRVRAQELEPARVRGMFMISE